MLKDEGIDKRAEARERARKLAKEKSVSKAAFQVEHEKAKKSFFSKFRNPKK